MKHIERLILGAALCLCLTAAPVLAYTIDCNFPVAAGSTGLYVVGDVQVQVNQDQTGVDLVGLHCVYGTDSHPYFPNDGVVGFCPGKDVDTNCWCHSEVAPSVTVSFCQSSPLQEPSLVESLQADSFNSTTVNKRGRVRQKK